MEVGGAGKKFQPSNKITILLFIIVEQWNIRKFHFRLGMAEEVCTVCSAHARVVQSDLN